MSENFLNAKGGVHGGTIYSLADFAFAVSSNLGGKLCVTLDANVTYFRPAKDTTPTFLIYFFCNFKNCNVFLYYYQQINTQKF